MRVSATSLPPGSGDRQVWLVGRTGTRAQRSTGRVSAPLSLRDGAVVALGPGQVLSLYIWQRRPWDKLLTNRLWTYEEPNGPADLNAIVRPDDFLRATKVLRRAKLCPCGGTHMPVAAPGAEGLTLKLIVGRPARWHPSDAPELHLQIRDCLRAAHIRARVAGEDIYP
jgi:hypothetical protein